MDRMMMGVDGRFYFTDELGQGFHPRRDGVGGGPLSSSSNHQNNNNNIIIPSSNSHDRNSGYRQEGP